ncbi:hypothetical protein FOA52_005684 [Chlamydomonas sp. UWO 241]|nr:hypothetical protein FOA52_005684 [Chlamydomonas sp. UWO 241]
MGGRDGLACKHVEANVIEAALSDFFEEFGQGLDRSGSGVSAAALADAARALDEENASGRGDGSVDEGDEDWERQKELATGLLLTARSRMESMQGLSADARRRLVASSGGVVWWRRLVAAAAGARLGRGHAAAAAAGAVNALALL